MTKEDILRLRDTAEQTKVQFKERVTRENKYDVSCEMVAQSNSHGGMIVVGIDDKTGRINPLSFQEVQETTNLLGRVFIFDNRIEIHSPGLLPEGVNLESIMHGASVPRNKLLFNHGINLLPYTGAGSGITRALKYTPDIKFVNDETLNEFVVTVERKDDDNRDKEAKDNPLITSDMGKDKPAKRDEDRDEETKDQNRVIRIPYKQLSNVQKYIIQYCSIPRTAKEIMDHIGYYNNSKNMSSLVKPLLELGFLEMTEPEKPNSKNQKYRKVRKK